MKKILILSIFLASIASPTLSNARKYTPFTSRVHYSNYAQMETKTCSSYSFLEKTCICDSGYYPAPDNTYCIKDTPDTNLASKLFTLCLYGTNTAACLKEVNEIIKIRDTELRNTSDYKDRFNTFYLNANKSFGCTFPYIFDWKINECAINEKELIKANEDCITLHGKDTYYDTDDKRCKAFSNRHLVKGIDTTTYENTYRYTPFFPEYSKIYWKKKRKIKKIHQKELQRLLSIETSRNRKSSRLERKSNLWHSSSKKIRSNTQDSKDKERRIPINDRHDSAPKYKKSKNAANFQKKTELPKSTEQLQGFNRSCTQRYGWNAYYKPSANACFCAKRKCNDRTRKLWLK